MNYYIKSNRQNKSYSIPTSETNIKPQDINSCMICTKNIEQLNQQNLQTQFCNKCIDKKICKACILQMSASACAFCHTNNKIWRFTKRKIIMQEINRKVLQKKSFWQAINISKKNIHLQYAIKCGIEESIQTLDSIIEKLADDVKYLIKLDFQKQTEENQKEVLKQIQQINDLQQCYDNTMVELKNQFQIQTRE